MQHYDAVGGAQKPKTNLHHTRDLLPEIDRPRLYPPRFTPGSRLEPTRGMTKEDAATAFKAWFAGLPSWDITVFSDGSKTAEGLGYGYAIYEGQTLVEEGRGSLDSCGVVFDAEALGALRGLDKARQLYPDAPITLCIDNTATIWCIQKDASPTSQWVFIKIHQLLGTGTVTLKWSPGHLGIEGNERADHNAAVGANWGPLDADSKPTVAGLRAMAKKEMQNNAAKWWRDAGINKPSGYEAAKITYRPGKVPDALRIQRKTLGWYLSTISAHGDYNWYHKYYGHANAEIHCLCSNITRGQLFKTPEHMVHCEEAWTHRDNWPKPPKPTAKDGVEPDPTGLATRLHNLDLTPSSRYLYWVWLLQHPKEFQAWCEATNYFQLMCPPFMEAGEWCCDQERRERAAEEAERVRIEEEGEESELEVVAPAVMPITATAFAAVAAGRPHRALH